MGESARLAGTKAAQGRIILAHVCDGASLAGVLYPFFGLLLSPIVAGAAMSVSSVSVISNALRLRNVKL